MNPSPQVRQAIYLILALANVTVCGFMLIAGKFTQDVIIGLTALNTIVLGLANVNVKE